MVKVVYRGAAQGYNKRDNSSGKHQNAGSIRPAPQAYRVEDVPKPQCLQSNLLHRALCSLDHPLLLIKQRAQGHEYIECTQQVIGMHANNNYVKLDKGGCKVSWQKATFSRDT